MPPGSPRSCSSTACGCCPAAGTAGPTLFEDAGYAALTPGWPDDPETVARGQRASGGVRGQVDRPGRRPLRRDRRPALASKPVDHRPLLRRPADPDPRRARPVGGVGGDRPGAVPRRAAAADLGAASRRRPVLGNPANRHRAVPLTYDQFRYAFANAVSEDEAQAAVRDLRRARVRACRSSRPRPPTSTRGPRPRSTPAIPDRGPLLLISGEKDHTVPWAITNASYKQQQRQQERDRDRRDARTAATR